MGGHSELDFREKLSKTRENLYRKLRDVRDRFSEIEKVKLDAMRKTDELKNSLESDLQRLEEDIEESKDLASESKERLRSEISILLEEVEEKYSKVRKRITETSTPT